MFIHLAWVQYKVSANVFYNTFHTCIQRISRAFVIRVSCHLLSPTKGSHKQLINSWSLISFNVLHKRRTLPAYLLFSAVLILQIEGQDRVLDRRRIVLMFNLERHVNRSKRSMTEQSSKQYRIEEQCQRKKVGVHHISCFLFNDMCEQIHHSDVRGAEVE